MPSRLAELVLKDQAVISGPEKAELSAKLDLIDKISMQIGVLAGQSSVTTINTTTQIGQLTLEKSGVGVAFSGGGLKSEDFASGSAGWQIAGAGDAEFNDVTARGVIYATSGDIAGWTINAANLTKNDATLASAGYLVLGTGNNIVKLDSQDATYRIWVGHATAASAPFRVEKDGGLVASDATITGSVTASTGAIGGWTIGATTLSNNNATLDSAGNLLLGSSNDIVKLDSQDGTYRLWAGNATAASAPFSVSKAGALASTSGAIGDWTIGATTLSNNNATLDSAGNLVLGSSNDIVKLDAADGTYRIWAGNATAASAPFRVTKEGAVTATSATITGSITATSGTIGGWTVSGNTLTATGIILDAGNQKITVGSAAPTIIIDGANKVIKSSNFTSGTSGFQLNASNGAAEFQNATIRGTLRSHITETNVQTSTSGTFIVNDSSDVLIADVANDALTIDVKAQALKRNGMVYMAPDATRTEWMRITNSGEAITGGYRYTVTRDLEDTGAFTYSAGESVITRGSATVESRGAMWGENVSGVEFTRSTFTTFGGLNSLYGWGTAKWGTTGCNFGGLFDFTRTEFSDGKLCQFGQTTMSFGGTGFSAFGGWVQLEGTAAEGPYLQVVRREGPAASDYQAYGRFGKLTGFLDYAASDDIGIGLGELGDSLSWDKQNGLRISAGADKTQLTGGYLKLPSLTRLERNALTASNGMLVYNEDDNKLQAYENGAWANLT